MTVATKYLCYKCGAMEKSEDIYSLSSYFQGRHNGNLGVRHMCFKCHEDFLKQFEYYFTFLNTTINE